MADTKHSAPELHCIIEALLLAAGEPLSVARIAAAFEDGEAPSATEISQALETLQSDLADRGIELVEVASGFRLQTRPELGQWVQRLWEERPQRYSRALLETLALIAYRQPITRGEIEEVRGVSVSSSIIRTLQEREWVRVVGHRDVPGKPALFGTTKAFLDYFQLKTLDDLPTLTEIRDMESLEPEFDFDGASPEGAGQDGAPPNEGIGEARQDDAGGNEPPVSTGDDETPVEIPDGDAGETTADPSGPDSDLADIEGSDPSDEAAPETGSGPGTDDAATDEERDPVAMAPSGRD